MIKQNKSFSAIFTSHHRRYGPPKTKYEVSAYNVLLKNPKNTKYISNMPKPFESP